MRAAMSNGPPGEIRRWSVPSATDRPAPLRAARSQGEWQRLLSVAEIDGVKFHGESPCFCCTSIPSLRALTGLLDHAVRPIEHLRRHRDTDVPRRLEVHD
jgi:hypothetical protein